MPWWRRIVDRTRSDAAARRDQQGYGAEDEKREQIQRWQLASRIVRRFGIDFPLGQVRIDVIAKLTDDPGNVEIMIVDMHTVRRGGVILCIVRDVHVNTHHTHQRERATQQQCDDNVGRTHGQPIIA